MSMYKGKEDSNGRQPEEIAMMPKRGWGSDGKVHEDDDDSHCGVGSCKPSFLQRFSGIWTFTIVVGVTSVGSEFMEMFLRFQEGGLRRQFEVEPSTVHWMVYSSQIACIISALFLSIFARRIHIPRVLAITSLICGVAGILCAIPFLATKDGLVPATMVSPNETYSIGRYRMMSPSCIVNKKAMAVVKRLMIEAAASQAGQPPKKSGNTAQASKPKNVQDPSKNSALGPNSLKDNSMNLVENELSPTDPPPIASNAPGSSGDQKSTRSSASKSTDAPKTPVGKKTIIIPNFKKLSTHENYPQFVEMAKTMGIDLVKVAAMDLENQIKYVDGLSPEVKAMLPNLKLMLGENPDSYFMEVTVDDTGSERRKRSTRKGRVNLETDLAYTGMLVKMMKNMPPLPPEIIKKAFKELCPFNSGPFMVNSSTGILKIINVAMVLHGIAKGPRIAYGVTYLSDNTKERTTALHLGILYGITLLGPVISMLVSFYVNTNYITLEDVGSMTIFNPRWLGAWWLGFIILALYAIIFALPLIFFPRRLKSPSKYTVNDTKSERSCFSIAGYVKELLSSLLRLCTSPVYLSLVLSQLMSTFVWVGAMAVIVTYVSHQFSLEPLIPGLYLLIFITFLGGVGVFIGGIISTKCRFSSLGNLKFALGLTCALVVIQACHLGLGCTQPTVDKGRRVVANISSDLCSMTCPCSDMSYAPGCGSDGRTYYSPCHAGCGEGYDGKFHDCKCIEDNERTVTPGYCPSCDLFYPFCIVICLGAIIMGIQHVPVLVATYRSVKPKDVPLAMGFLSMLFIAVVTISSPIVYKKIQDSQCLHRIPECGQIDTCILYDIENVRYQIFGLSLGLEFVAAVLLLVAFIVGRKSTVYHDQIYANDQIKS